VAKEMRSTKTRGAAWGDDDFSPSDGDLRRCEFTLARLTHLRSGHWDSSNTRANHNNYTVSALYGAEVAFCTVASHVVDST
jgi:hypothetical protein